MWFIISVPFPWRQIAEIFSDLCWRHILCTVLCSRTPLTQTKYTLTFQNKYHQCFSKFHSYIITVYYCLHICAWSKLGQKQSVKCLKLCKNIKSCERKSQKLFILHIRLDQKLIFHPLKTLIKRTAVYLIVIVYSMSTISCAWIEITNYFKLKHSEHLILVEWNIFFLLDVLIWHVIGCKSEEYWTLQIVMLQVTVIIISIKLVKQIWLHFPIITTLSYKSETFIQQIKIWDGVFTFQHKGFPKPKLHI